MRTCIYRTCIMILVHVHAKGTNLRFHWNVFPTLWEHDLVQTSFGCFKKAFGVSFEHIQTLNKQFRFLVRTRLTSRSNAFGFSFERVWLLKRVWLFVQLHFASHWNEFGFSFECVSCNNQTRPGCSANAFGQEKHYTLCLTGIVALIKKYSSTT